MANEVNLIDCIEQETGKQIVMRGDTYVYFDTKKDVESNVIEKAIISKQEKELENSKQDKSNEIKNDFLKQEKENVLIGDVEYQGGYDSAIKLDSAKRLSESAGLETVVFYDAENAGHELSLTDANIIVLQIAGKYQKDFGKYQSLKVDIEKATTVNEVEIIKW